MEHKRTQCCEGRTYNPRAGAPTRNPRSPPSPLFNLPLFLAFTCSDNPAFPFALLPRQPRFTICQRRKGFGGNGSSQRTAASHATKVGDHQYPMYCAIHSRTPPAGLNRFQMHCATHAVEHPVLFSSKCTAHLLQSVLLILDVRSNIDDGRLAAEAQAMHQRRMPWRLCR